MKIPSSAIALLLFLSPLASGADTDFGDANNYYDRLKKELNPLNPTEDVARRKFTRLGNRTVRIETFISTEMDRGQGKLILSDFENYPLWALRRINERPGGGEYRLKLTSLTPDAQDRSILQIGMAFTFPLFSHSGTHRFKFRSEEGKNHFRICTESLPGPGTVMSKAEGCARVFPAPGQAKNRAWIHAEANAVLKSAILYELLPEAVLSRILGERVEKIVENYLQRQDELTQPRKVTSPAPAPKKR